MLSHIFTHPYIHCIVNCFCRFCFLLFVSTTFVSFYTFPGLYVISTRTIAQSIKRRCLKMLTTDLTVSFPLSVQIYHYNLPRQIIRDQFTFQLYMNIQHWFIHGCSKSNNLKLQEALFSQPNASYILTSQFILYLPITFSFSIMIDQYFFSNSQIKS